jgi:hypothetical protein
MEGHFPFLFQRAKRLPYALVHRRAERVAHENQEGLPGLVDRYRPDPFLFVYHLDGDPGFSERHRDESL